MKYLIILALCVSFNAFAATENKDFIRKVAKKAAAEIAPNLPMQVSKELTIQMVGAFDTTLAISVKMAYDYDYLKSAGAASGVTPESLKAKMQVMCVEGLFLRKGG